MHEFQGGREREREGEVMRVGMEKKKTEMEDLKDDKFNQGGYF